MPEPKTTITLEEFRARAAGTGLPLTEEDIEHLHKGYLGLLELMLSHPRQVFTREQMLNRVWGYSWTGDANVVEVHISSLRDKVGDTERQLIRTVRGVGYTLRG